MGSMNERTVPPPFVEIYCRAFGPESCAGICERNSHVGERVLVADLRNFPLRMRNKSIPEQTFRMLAIC